MSAQGYLRQLDTKFRGSHVFYVGWMRGTLVYNDSMIFSGYSHVTLAIGSRLVQFGAWSKVGT